MYGSLFGHHAPFGISPGRPAVLLDYIYTFDYQAIPAGKNMQNLAGPQLLGVPAVLPAPDYYDITFFNAHG